MKPGSKPHFAPPARRHELYSDLVGALALFEEAIRNFHRHVSETHAKAVQDTRTQVAIAEEAFFHHCGFYSRTATGRSVAADVSDSSGAEEFSEDD